MDQLALSGDHVLAGGMDSKYSTKDEDDDTASVVAVVVDDDDDESVCQYSSINCTNSMVVKTKSTAGRGGCW